MEVIANSCAKDLMSPWNLLLLGPSEAKILKNSYTPILEKDLQETGQSTRTIISVGPWNSLGLRWYPFYPFLWWQHWSCLPSPSAINALKNDNNSLTSWCWSLVAIRRLSLFWSPHAWVCTTNSRYQVNISCSNWIGSSTQYTKFQGIPSVCITFHKHLRQGTGSKRPKQWLRCTPHFYLH